MYKNSKADKKDEEGISLLDQLGEIYEWLQIVVAILIVGMIIGSIVYFPNPTKDRLTISIFLLVISLIAGIIIAQKSRQKNKDNTSNS